MKNFLDFSNKLINENLFEDYKSIHIRFIAYKEDRQYYISHFRFQFSSQSEGQINSYESIDKESIYIEETIKVKDFLQCFQYDKKKMYFILFDNKYWFHDYINEPNSYEEFLTQIDSKYQKYNILRSKNLMSILYCNTLYNLDGNYNQYEINGNSRITNQDIEIKYPVLELKYNKNIFFIKGELLNGQEIIEKEMGLGSLLYNIPIILIEFPIESFKFSIKTRSWDKKKVKININWDVDNKYKEILEIFYAVQEDKQIIEEKNLIIEKNLEEFKNIDILIWWKGNPQILKENTRLFWIQLNNYYDTTQNIENIKNLKERIKEFKKVIIDESSIENRLKYSLNISNIYGKIINEYTLIYRLGIIDFSRKIWLYKQLRLRYYGIYISLYLDTIPLERQNFQNILRYCSLLYLDFIENKNLVYEEQQKRLKKRDSYFGAGESPIIEINILYYNINNAVKIIQKNIENGFIRNENPYLFLENFEILGDLHIHQAILRLISDNGLFLKTDIDLDIALKCYKKALKYKKIVEIPGVGMLSIYVQEYMRIYNIFMREGYLEGKINFINSIINPDKETKKAVNIQYSTSLDSLIENVSTKINKISITELDLLRFLDQFTSEELKRAILILLDKAYIRTNREIIIELKEQINIQIDNLKNTYIILFPDTELKSNILIANQLPKLTNIQFNFIRSEQLTEKLNECQHGVIYDFLYLDDVIGIGNQCVDLFDKYLSNEYSKIQEIVDHNPNIRFWIISCFGSQESKCFISSRIRFIHHHNIIFKTPIRKEDKAFSKKKEISVDTMNKLKIFLEEADNKWWRGRDNCEYLVLTESNTPNCSIGCLWRKESNIKPLHHRIHYPI
ncbi:MAG: hypothetical protein JXA99_12520 [Candidatus Lokiarchaeota archaeon]|nr:hypothetical protein [Candidatus Lokiarchaeota archaeon]